MTSTNQNLGKIGPDLSRQSAMDETTKRNEQQATLFRSSGGAASIQCPTTQGSTQNSIMKNNCQQNADTNAITNAMGKASGGGRKKSKRKRKNKRKSKKKSKRRK